MAWIIKNGWSMDNTILKETESKAASLQTKKKENRLV
jgi:hypothetical protein